ncbi:MAG: hypothetical protein PVG51_03635 [Desulfosarcina sp.]
MPNKDGTGPGNSRSGKKQGRCAGNQRRKGAGRRSGQGKQGRRGNGPFREDNADRS